MTDRDSSSKLIDNNMSLSSVSAPKLGQRIFTVSVHSGFTPSPTRLSCSSWTPEDNNASDHSNWASIVCRNSSETPIMTNSNLGLGLGLPGLPQTQYSRIRQVPISVPILLSTFCRRASTRTQTGFLQLSFLPSTRNSRTLRFW